MGTYVYRVTKETVVCSDGQKANVAIFAFKPCFSPDDAKMAFKSGCVASDRMAAKGDITDRVVIGFKDDVSGKVKVYLSSAVFKNIHNLGSFYDSTIGMPNQFPTIDGVIPRIGKI